MAPFEAHSRDLPAARAAAIKALIGKTVVANEEGDDLVAEIVASSMHTGLEQEAS